MGPVFSNYCVFSEEILEELNKKMMSNGYKTYCTFFVIFYLLFSAVSFKAGQNVMGVIFAVGFICILVIFFTKSKLIAKRAYSKYIKLYGCEIETRTFFYDEMIIGKNLQSNQSVQASYSDVTEIKESHNLYIIKLHKNIALTLSKNGFISDNASEFIKFIIGKCPNAKIKL